MKNKMMIGAMAAMLAATSANAYNQADKDRCLANPDKVVWVESKGACVPKNPCDGKYDYKYIAYCSEKFGSVVVDSVDTAINMVKSFHATSMNVPCNKAAYVIDSAADVSCFTGPYNEYFVYAFSGVMSSGITTNILNEDISFCRKYNCGYDVSYKKVFQCDCTNNDANYDGIKKVEKVECGEGYCEVKR
ncbi:MAG: hypothetical protein LBJ73_01080 [Rickettsiales bacterium]|nr:hypothetical protein [Rickettsiales bacterium]